MGGKEVGGPMSVSVAQAVLCNSSCLSSHTHTNRAHSVVQWSRQEEDENSTGTASMSEGEMPAMPNYAQPSDRADVCVGVE